MIYSPWGAYVPMGDSQYGAAAGGPTQQSGAAPGSSPGAGAWFSPEAITTYGNVLTNVFGTISGRASPPPPVTTPSSSTPWLLIGGLLVGGLLLFKVLKKRS